MAPDRQGLLLVASVRGLEVSYVRGTGRWLGEGRGGRLGEDFQNGLIQYNAGKLACEKVGKFS